MANILKSPKRTAGNKWLETVNPINALSIAEAKSVYDAARRYGSPRLQKIYDEIELTDPILMTCVERRQSALSGLGWQVKPRASADATLADEQRNAADGFLSGIENFTAALEHLELAFFRGFSHCQPIWEGNTVRRIHLLNSWNFLTGEDGEWLWNPECSSDPRLCVAIEPSARLISLVRRRAIDYPALSIYIRKALGERDWGRFIERYGIPPVDVVMAPNTTDEQRDDYLTSAERARDGLPTAWPSGSAVSRAEGSRGQDPFTSFVEHQEKLIVLASTGGTLTSLAQSDTGALAGGAQMDVWREIVLRDALIIADVVERSLVRPFIEAAFPGRPMAISFELGVERKPTASEAAEIASKIKLAGFTVDQAQLEEATGFKLARDMASALPGLATARATSARGNPDSLLAALSSDNQPISKALKELLKDPSNEAIKAFLADLPTLLPDDPAMAAAMAEEMARTLQNNP